VNNEKEGKGVVSKVGKTGLTVPQQARQRERRREAGFGRPKKWCYVGRRNQFDGESLVIDRGTEHKVRREPRQSCAEGGKKKMRAQKNVIKEKE